MGPIVEPDPNGMDPKTGPKIGPGRILLKPEALLHDLEYMHAYTYMRFSNHEWYWTLTASPSSAMINKVVSCSDTFRSLPFILHPVR